MRDMANLARAMIFVMGVSIKVSDYLYAQRECREDKHDRQQTFAWVLGHDRPYMTPGRIVVRTGVNRKHVSSDHGALYPGGRELVPTVFMVENSIAVSSELAFILNFARILPRYPRSFMNLSAAARGITLARRHLLL